MEVAKAAACLLGRALSIIQVLARMFEMLWLVGYYDCSLYITSTAV
jgi:hypothetical protein